MTTINDYFSLALDHFMSMYEVTQVRMTKTMSIRMDRDNYEFLAEISKEERSDLSKAGCPIRGVGVWGF